MKASEKEIKQIQTTILLIYAHQAGDTDATRKLICKGLPHSLLAKRLNKGKTIDKAKADKVLEIYAKSIFSTARRKGIQIPKKPKASKNPKTGPVIRPEDLGISRAQAAAILKSQRLPWYKRIFNSIFK